MKLALTNYRVKMIPDSNQQIKFIVTDTTEIDNEIFEVSFKMPLADLIINSGKLMDFYQQKQKKAIAAQAELMKKQQSEQQLIENTEDLIINSWKLMNFYQQEQKEELIENTEAISV